LTSNAVVLGGGSQASKTVTAFTTDGAAVLTVGVAGGGNGAVALAGNTSGTATFTAPAVAGTVTNPVTMSNNLASPAGSSAATAYGLAGTPTSGMFFSGTEPVINSTSGSARVFLQSGGVSVANTLPAGLGALVFGASSAIGSGFDVGISRTAAGIFAVGTGAAASKAGLIQSGMSKFVTANFTTSGVGTALEVITGLAITVPAVAANWTFHAHLAYSQAVGTAAVAFGIQAATNNPTNIFATGEMFTAAGTVTTGVLATLATTTATNIVTGTPGGTGTNLVVDLYGTCELGASANTIQILVSTATAADLVTVLRGSYFHFNC